ncbi:DUF6884 domain-containing protein [Aquibacillus salsiterrae]|uniref:DUF6884 domain-containing protein n=1 Tax=Aquibacillus salsiterrae TaxID=2950439 RepID=A0A9X4AG03_9BACI|nr:DUF6884 domain-containing protein [Aquibacillus salsiterrae]MDC3416573.1 hypothetical protein [Aquibacillus salsiterrae]
MDLCIIPCGRKKIWDKYEDNGPVQAKDAYIGTLHQLSQHYAVDFCDEWVILSAKYGFLLPDDCVEGNYDLSFGNKQDGVIAIDQLVSQVESKQLNRFARVIALTGKKYRPIIEACFPVEKVRYPLANLRGIGYIQQELKSAITKGEPFHL